MTKRATTISDDCPFKEVLWLKDNKRQLHHE